MAFTNFETLFLEVSVTIWHLSTREPVRKKKKNLSTIKKKKVKCDSQYKLWIVLENFQATNFNQNLNALWLSCLHLVRKQFFFKITFSCGVLSSLFSGSIQAQRYVLAIPKFKISFSHFYHGVCILYIMQDRSKHTRSGSQALCL